MAVQNAARFGIRYAVTGEFKEIYCIEAGNLLGGAHVAADMDGGDPQDCKIPDTYTNADKHDKERELIDPLLACLVKPGFTISRSAAIVVVNT